MRAVALFMIVLAFLALLAAPAGQVVAQSAMLGGTGSAVISDGVVMPPLNILIPSAVITYSMTGVTPPADGTAYEGWLVSDDESVKLSTGVMEVGAEGTIEHVFESPDDENLLRRYSKVVVTIEPVPDDDPTPSGDVVFRAEVPADAMAHIRNLVVSWPPGTEDDHGILLKLRRQLERGVQHTDRADQSSDVEGIHFHTHHVINILDGEDGEYYHSPSGNPGMDAIGVLTYAAARDQAALAAQAAPDNPIIASEAKIIDTAARNAGLFGLQARDHALFLLDQGVENDARPELGALYAYLHRALDGVDSNGDGVVEPGDDEGGARDAYIAGQRMATYALEPVPFIPAEASLASPVSAPVAATEVDAPSGAPQPSLAANAESTSSLGPGIAVGALTLAFAVAAGLALRLRGGAGRRHEEPA